MNRFSRFHSINFILWLSFLIFAAFIIGMTWIFQTTLLRVFFKEQVKQDLDSLGQEATTVLSASFPVLTGDRRVDTLIDFLQGENPAATLLILDDSGEVLYPTDVRTGETEEDDVPDFELFSRIRYELGGAGEDIGAVIMELNGSSYAYMSVIGAEAGTNRPVYLYISYSTELSNMAFATMRLQLVLISVVVIFLALIISAFLSLKLTKPISQITKAAKRMATGDFSVNFKGEYSYAEMDALAETLDYAKEEIEKSDQLQKEVLANVTHDLKTPLTMIKAYASMIKEISGDNPEKRAKHTQVIIDESDRLTSLVNDILNLSKIRSGMDSLKVENFNLSEFVHTVIERFDYLCETKGYVIEREIEDELYTEADMEKIEQVVYNLVGNAVNYTGDDKKIRVGLARAEGGKLRFTVSDTGRGIPEEERKTIWDRYYRSSETHKRPIRGTGLGLSIVKNILLQHDCPFGVISEQGKGSCFWAEFPLVTDEWEDVRGDSRAKEDV